VKKAGVYRKKVINGAVATAAITSGVAS